jgi:ferric-dicitrate binding protein FerR (iron transport regulator)
MRRGKLKTSTMWVCMLTGLFLYNTAYAGDCDEWVAKIVSIQGEVKAKKSGATQWTPVKFDDTFCPGDMLRVQQRSRAAVILNNESVTRLDQNTSVTFKRVEEKKVSFIDIIKGAAHFFSRVPRSLKFSTPFVNGAVEGTEFFVEVGDDQTLISVFRGRVAAANDAGSINLGNGQAAIARSGKAPMAHLVVNPRDAVQWAVYYPAVIDYKASDFEGSADTWQGKVRKSIRFYREGDLANAFSSLEGVPVR